MIEFHRWFRKLMVLLLIECSWISLAFSGVVINEIMYRPSSLLTDDEYIELLNSGPDDADLSGWSFRSGVSFTFPVGVSLAVGQVLVISPSPEGFVAHYGNYPVIGPYSGHLSNQGETLELVDSLGNRMDQVAYRDEEGWPTAADGLGVSLERLHPAMPSNYPQSWQASKNGGSAGRLNSIALPDPLPIVHSIQQNPVIPSSTDGVKITCQVVHSLPIQQVTLYFKSEKVGTFTELPMFDDGQHADGMALDGGYGGELPAFSDGTIVEFYIAAGDIHNVSGCFPLTAPKRTAFYLVDDTVYTATLPLYRVVMRTADERTLRTRDPYSNGELDASFIYNNIIYYDVGLRFRGKGSRQKEPKSYRINFADTRYFGAIRKLDLNAINISNQYIGLECFKRLRLPAPEKRFVSLVFNRTFVPNYLQVERTDRYMMQRIFGNDQGNIYRGVEHAELDYRGEDKNSYRANYTKETNELADDYTDLIRLCDAFSNSTDEEFPAIMAQHINVRQWIRWFAAKEFLNDMEGGLSLERGDDYYLYHNPSNDLFYLLPWDLDSVLTEPFQLPHHHGTPAVRRLLRHPDLARFYYDEIMHMLMVELPQEVMDSIIDQTAPVTDEKKRADLKDISRRLRAYLLQHISQELTVQVKTDNIGNTTSIVSSADEWRYFRGVREPASGTLDWTLPTFNDSGWEKGAGGFGYSEGNHGTILSDMQNHYTTLYIRKTFTIDKPEIYSSLSLTVAVDDGFVAYLNGVEIARYNFEGIPRYNAQALQSVEVGNPIVFAVNHPTSLLQSGQNTLAVVGFNANLSSSDFTLDVNLEGYKAVPDNFQLQGTAEAAHTRWVYVNGAPADYTPWKAQWDYTGTLNPGRNRFLIEALDADQSILDATRLVVYQGIAEPTDCIEIVGNEVWTRAQSPIMVNQTIVVPAGDSLTLNPGVALRFAANAGIVVFGSLTVSGTELDPVHFEPLNSDSPGGGIAVDAAVGPVTVSHADFSNLREFTFRGKSYPASISVRDSTVSVEHSRFTGATSSGIDGIRSVLTVRHNHFEAMGEAVHGDTCSSWVEENTFLQILGYNDVIDFDNQMGPCDIRNNVIDGSQDDGIDIGYCSANIEGNRISHCNTNDPARGSSKGISLEGNNGSFPVINNVIFQCDIGIAVKDSCHVETAHNTIVSCATGIALYEKNPGKGGGWARIVYSVIWDTQTTISLDTKSEVELDTNDLLPLPPAFELGNFSRDPMFMDIQSGNLALQWGSPLIDAAEDSAIKKDILGLPRPSGPKSDIGAYEYDQSTPIKAWGLYK